MTQEAGYAHRLDRSRLRPLEAECFPRYMTVRTDKPTGLVYCDQDLVCFEATNVVIRIRQTVRDESVSEDTETHPGPLSLLFTLGGRQAYEIDGRRFVLDEHFYLIHNLGQAITGFPADLPDTESFTIGFWPGVAEDVLRSLVTPQDHLLDSPRAACSQPVRFFDQLYPHSACLSPLLARLRAAMDDARATKGFWEELNYQLLTAMLYEHRNIGREIEMLPAMRAATRAELYRRLHRARDFMEAGLDQPLTITQIAQEAWFSPYHFLRQFKEVFGETPHQYLKRRRLEWARSLLVKSDKSITDICSTVGFESLGSFSSLLRQYLGDSPQQFRLRNRNVQHSFSHFLDKAQGQR